MPIQSISTLVTNYPQPPEGVYPFVDAASMTSREGARLVPGAVLDARLYPPGGLERQYLSLIEHDGVVIRLTVSDASGVLATGEISAGSNDSAIVMRDTYGRVVGLIVGRPSLLPAGTHNFDAEATEFSARAVVPQPDTGVTGILVDGVLHTGDVWLVGEDGVALSYEDDQLAVHLTGDVYAERRSCIAAALATAESSSAANAPQFPLQSLDVQLNGVLVNTLSPDVFGNIQLLPIPANSALRVISSTNRLTIKVAGNA